jgi:hypothetical protein
MQKYAFSIKTRSGQLIERLVIAGKNREDAERKLNQMYHFCEIVRCEAHCQSSTIQKQATSIEDLMSLIPR